MLTIALSKGHLLNESIELFKKAGIDIKENEKISRKLEFYDESGKYRFLILRPADVPVYVEYGAADIGITGKDVLVENDSNVAELLDLKRGYCKLVVAALKKDKYTKDKLSSDMRVGTKFVNSSESYFKKKGLNIDLIKLYGSVEMAPHGGLVDVIVDLVATGNTLKENGLEIIDTIYESTSRLVANSIKIKTHYDEIIGLAKKLKEFL